MSITKSVLALLVGCLLDRKKLRLDQPVHELFPAWQSERQRKVSVRHLLTHSSGLEESERTYDIYASRDFVQHALRSPLVHEPGTHYEYGNRASNLLSGMIAKLAGSRTDEFARQCLLSPLGITRFSWSRDRAGNAHGLAGLHLMPRDLARIGELVLADGAWQGRQLISRESMRTLTAEPAAVQPEHKRLAHLWWLLPAWTRRTIEPAIVDGWRRAGVESELIEQVQPLVGKPFASSLALVRALREATGDPELRRFEQEIWKKELPDSRVELGPTVGTYAAGSLGQYLVVVPEHALVAVRMRRSPKPRPARDDFERSFPDFADRVLGLVAR
jgi:CubicO group peptidase (beta-lactamase class C family)